MSALGWVSHVATGRRRAGVPRTSRRKSSGGRRLIWSLVASLVVITSLVGVARWVAVPDKEPFVVRSGRDFLLGGEPFRFVGFNLYDAAASSGYSCRPATMMSDAELAQTLSWAKEKAGATVIRFWAYQSYTRSATDFTGVDRVLAVARENGLKVLPVLDDGPGDCSGVPGRFPKAELNGGKWYETGYGQVRPPATLSYRDYVAKIVAHYRDDPTILGWSMMNEAETWERDAQGRSVLVNFARDVGSVIRAHDPHHLVTVGTQSNGAPGASGADFTEVYGLPQVDFAEVHDWGHWGDDTDPMPGSSDGGTLPGPASEPCRVPDAMIACSFSLARSLGKPLVVGEAGIAATDAAGYRRRADLLAAKMRAAFAAGADGYLVWHLNSGPTDTYDVIAGGSDPLVSVMLAQSRQLGS